MATRLTLLCHAATRAMREGGFPALDDPVEARWQDAVLPSVPGNAVVMAAPDLAARQTADLLKVEPMIVPALRDIDHGGWTGRSFADVHATDPDGLARWIADPAAGVPGGESYGALMERIDGWIGEQAGRDAPCLAIASPSVIRAAIALALDMPVAVALRIDIAPLSRTILSFNRVWRLQAIQP